MAVFVKLRSNIDPIQFNQSIKDKIKQQISPIISVDEDGDYCCSYSDLYDDVSKHGYLRFKHADKEKVVFGYIGRNDHNATVGDWSKVHSTMCEYLLDYFDEDIEYITCTSTVDKNYDVING